MSLRSKLTLPRSRLGQGEKSVLFTKVISGGIVDVNASNDYISVPFNLNPVSEEFTICLSAYFLTAGNFDPSYNMQLYSQADGTGTGRSWLTSPLVGGNISSALGVTTRDSGFYPYIKKFQNIYLVKTGVTQATSAITFYRDYAQGNTFNSSSTPALMIESASGNHLIGISKGINRCFDGNIALARGFSRPLSFDEIKSITANRLFDRGGLEYEYLFKETSGSTCFDTSGNDRHGILNNGAAFNALTPLPMRERLSVARQSLNIARSRLGSDVVIPSDSSRVVVSNNYTVTVDQNGYYFAVLGIGSPISINLPSVATVGTDFEIYFKDEGLIAGIRNITITPNGLDTIEHQINDVLNTAGESRGLRAGSGGNWEIIF